MATCLVGIDTGGTRTNVQVVVDGPEQFERYYEVGEAISGSLAPSMYASMLRKILAPMEAYWHDNDVRDMPVRMFMSSAGFAPSVREEFLDAITDVLPTMLGGAVEVFGVANDTVALLLGHDCQAAVIAGTGSNVMARGSDGEIHQIGGHGWVSCDYGSGFWIGLRGVRQAYRDREEAVDSVLLQRLRQTYSVRGAENDRRLIAKLRELAVADENMKPEVARFAASICDAAARGDVPAQDIVKYEAEELGDVTAVLLRRTFSTEELNAGIEIIQSGSLFSSDFYKAVFEAQVDLRLRSRSDQQAEIRWHSVGSGREAAVNLARRLTGNFDELLRARADFRPLIVPF